MNVKRKITQCAILGGLLLALHVNSPILAEGEALQDAFAPSLQPAADAATPGTVMGLSTVEVSLEGISLGENKGVVVINGEIYKTGESKNGIEVVQIRRKDADIMINGLLRTVKLREEDPSMIAGISGEVTKRKIAVSFDEDSGGMQSPAEEPAKMHPESQGPGGPSQMNDGMPRDEMSNTMKGSAFRGGIRQRPRRITDRMNSETGENPMNHGNETGEDLPPPQAAPPE